MHRMVVCNDLKVAGEADVCDERTAISPSTLSSSINWS